MVCLLWGLVLFSNPQQALDYVNRLPTARQIADAKIVVADHVVSVQYCRNYGRALTTKNTTVTVEGSR